MNKYVIISIEECGQFEHFKSSILVKVNPVHVDDFGSRDMGHYVAHECAETLRLLFRNNQINNKLAQLKSYAQACESGVFLGLDIDNWFEEREIIVNNNGNISSQEIFISLDHDKYFDEMDYYYQTHVNEEYSKFKEEQYIEQQRRRRAAGLMYDDYIDSLDEEDDWDY